MLDLATCPKHGWLTHAALHESAHAVFAVRLGFDFTEVRVEAPRRFENTSAGVVAGGVMLADPDPRNWVPRRSSDALDFVLSGACAENSCLGHTLPNSFAGDLEIWKHGMSLREGLDREEAGPVIAASRRRVEARLEADLPAIRRVFELLTAPLNPVDGRYENFVDPLRLHFDDVVALVNSPA